MLSTQDLLPQRIFFFNSHPDSPCEGKFCSRILSNIFATCTLADGMMEYPHNVQSDKCIRI